MLMLIFVCGVGAAAAGASNETRDLRTKIYEEMCAAIAKATGADK